MTQFSLGSRGQVGIMNARYGQCPGRPCHRYMYAPGICKSYTIALQHSELGPGEVLLSLQTRIRSYLDQSKLGSATTMRYERNEFKQGHCVYIYS